MIRSLLQKHGVLAASSDRAPSEISVEERSDDKTQRARPGLTAQPTYEQFLLYVLARQPGGTASKADATRCVMELMKQKGLIGPSELQRVSTGETKAENTIAWGRNALKAQGLISRDSPKGIWQLIPEGVNRGKAVRLPEMPVTKTRP